MSVIVRRGNPAGIFQTAARAWMTASLVLMRRPKMFLVIVAVVAALSWAYKLSGSLVGAYGDGHGHFSAQPFDTALLEASVTLLFVTINAFLLAPVAIVTHRLVLLGEDAPSMPSRPVVTTIRFALWVAALQFAADIPDLMLIFDVPHPTLTGFIARLVIAIATIRLTLIFPAVAIEAPGAPARESWRHTRWRFWRTAIVLFLTELPLLMVLGLLVWVLTRSAIGLAIAAIVASPFLSWLDVPFVAAAAAAASWMFISYREADSV